VNVFLLAASAASFITFALHTWLGGPEVAGPLLRSGDMRNVAKYTNYYCWHLVTIMLFAMGCALVWAAYNPDGIELAWFMLFLALSFMVWNLWLLVWKKQSFIKMPQWFLFLVISVFTGLGVAS